MRISSIKNFKRGKDFFVHFFILLIINCWVFSGWPKIFDFQPKINNATAYNSEVLALSPSYRWLLSGNENDSVGVANSDGGTDPNWVDAIIPNSESSQSGDYNNAGRTLIPNQSNINVNTAYQKSISAWVVVDTADTTLGGRIIWGEGGSSNGLVLYVYNNTLYFLVYESSTRDYVSYAITTGNVYHIGAVLDCTNGTMYLYLNGSLVSSKTGGLNISTSFLAHSAGAAIGGYDSALKNHAGTTMTGYAYFDGRISDVAYWAETILSGANFAAIYDYGIGEASNVVTVETSETQEDEISIPSSNQYIGGNFSITNTGEVVNVTSVSITESGTVDATTDLDNIKLFYDLDVTAPYDCESESYGGTESQYGSTNTDGFSFANTSTFTGSVAVSSTQTICLYPVLDIGSGVSSGETLELGISNPSTEVVLSVGTTTPTTAVNISGTSYFSRIRYVQFATSTQDTATSLTCTLDAAATTGNLLVTAVATDKSAGIYTIPSGFTLIQSDVNANVSAAWAYKIAAGGETAVHWSQTTGADMACWVGEYSGLAASDVLDVSTSTSSGDASVTSWSTGTTTATTADNELVFGFVTADTFNNIASNRAWTNGFSEKVWVPNADYGAPVNIAVKETATTGQQETTFSTTASGDQMMGFIAAFKFPIASAVTVGATGAQNSSVNFPVSDQYVGGAFTLANSGASLNVTSVSISATGTVNTATDLDNIKLFYDLDITAPYDCASESYEGGETQFGSTDTDGFSATGTSTFTGSVAISSSQTMCVYTVLDVGSGATTNETLDIEITNPATYVILSSGVAAPSTAVAISGSATLSGPSVIVSSTGSQEATIDIPTATKYVGGAFSFVRSNSTTVNITGIGISQSGTVSGDTELDNIKLYYDLDTSAPYDCASESYGGSETQYGDTDFDSFSAGTQMSSFSGSVAVSSSQALCVYTILDILEAADDDDTLEIEITNPTTDITVSGGDISPATAVSISGTTVLNLPPNLKQTHYRWRNDNGYESDFDAGDGADGNLSLGSSFNLNTQATATYPDGVVYRVGGISGSQITLRNAAGSTLGNTNGIAAGDEILIINMQGVSGDASSTGNYEFLEVQSVSGGVITVASSPTKDYDGSGNSFSNQKVFVQRVPNYINVTTGSYSITAGAWDNGTDHDDSSCTDNQYTGIVAFRANGVVTVSSGGTISANALGYSGGLAVYGVGTAAYSYQGDSASGTGANLRSANMGGGGGGYNDTTGASTSGASGGGGGYGAAGTAGNDSPEDVSSGGSGGGAYGDSTLSQIFLGSGGGGGGGDRNGEVYTTGTNGAAGGGIILISARHLAISGTISSNGASSTASTGQYYGSGGAGSGGSIYIASASSTLGASLVTATGGIGGCGATSYCGGNGGVGRIRIAMTNYIGSSSPSASVTTTPTGQVTAAGFAFAEDTPYTDMLLSSRKRLRFLINNDGSDAGSLNYILEFAQHASCSAGSYAPVPVDDSADWKISATSYIADGEATIDLGSGLSNPTAQNFVIGQIRDATNTVAVNLPASNFSEIEFAIEAVSANADPGTQYCFRLTSVGQTITYTNYAIANMSVASGDLQSDIVDSGGTAVENPFLLFSTTSLSFTFQTVTSTLGVVDQKIRVSNQTSSAPWTLTIASTSTTALWTGLSNYYDFNDATASVGDGGDADNYGGQLTIDPTTATITPQVGCDLTGLTLGSSASFFEGVTDSVTLLNASEAAGVECYWDITNISLSQAIPAEQSSGSYVLDMVITVTAI